MASDATSTTTIQIIRGAEFIVLEPTQATGDKLNPEDMAMIETITEFERETARLNWDGERGEPLSALQWSQAREVMREARTGFPSEPSPHVGPCGDGTVHLTWLIPHVARGVLEIGRDEWWWSVIPVEGDDENVKVDLHGALRRIREFLQLKSESSFSVQR